jgi:hypothetical protein
MRKLLYIPAVVFAIASFLDLVLFTAFLFGFGVEKDAGQAALMAIFAFSGAFVTVIMLEIARN